MDWFLYDIGLRHEKVKMKFFRKILYGFWPLTIFANSYKLNVRRVLTIFEKSPILDV